MFLAMQLYHLEWSCSNCLLEMANPQTVSVVKEHFLQYDKNLTCAESKNTLLFYFLVLHVSYICLKSLQNFKTWFSL